jgi:hypothetical protein
LPGFYRFKFEFHSFFAETFSTASVKGGEDSQGRSSPKCPDYSESDQLGGVATNVPACHEPL